MVVEYRSCLDCTERHVGCHGGCKSYKLYREKLDKIKEARRKSEIIPSHKTSKRSKSR